MSPFLLRERQQERHRERQVCVCARWRSWHSRDDTLGDLNGICLYLVTFPDAPAACKLPYCFFLQFGLALFRAPWRIVYVYS
jgi:hypothetical protein